MNVALKPLLALATLAAAALFTACGGGGGGSGITTGGVSSWVKGQFSPASSFAALCVAPRTGIDPGTGQAYPDRQGTALDEKNWLRSWTNDLYLWFDEVPDQNPAGFATDAAYFDVLKTTAITASASPRINSISPTSTATWESLSQSGVQPDTARTS